MRLSFSGVLCLAAVIGPFSSGRLSDVKTMSTVPADFYGRSNSAEIEVDAKGKFLYASNRGNDSIAVFAISPRTGKLTLIEHVPTQGRTPLKVTFDPTGRYLFAANQDTNNVVVFRIEPHTGRLKPTGQLLDVQSPVCCSSRRQDGLWAAQVLRG